MSDGISSFLIKSTAAGTRTSRKWLWRKMGLCCCVLHPHMVSATSRIWCKSSRGGSVLTTLWKSWLVHQVRRKLFSALFWSDADPSLHDSSHPCTQVVWMVVANWRPYLVRTQRSFSRKWRRFTGQSAPCCQRTTPAWLSCTTHGSAALERREPKSCCTPGTTLWRRWKTGSLWNGDPYLLPRVISRQDIGPYFFALTIEPSK